MLRRVLSAALIMHQEGERVDQEGGRVDQEGGRVDQEGGGVDQESGCVHKPLAAPQIVSCVV